MARSIENVCSHVTFAGVVRFDQPCRKIAGAVEYFREHMLGDYLTEGGQSEMTWYGFGAARLGLTGRCRQKDFEALCAGRDPRSGARLNARDKGANRRVCFFGQISAPKDVSVACLVGGDARILKWWDEAVRETLREIEAVASTRVRRGGADSDRTTGNLVAAVVTHDTNRALDPQLHTHVCIMNLTYDEVENRWKGMQPSAFYRHQGYFREVCYNRLAARMRDAGYELESVRGIGFNIVGFPSELRQAFSKRRQEILRRAAAAQTTSQDDLQAITAQSRAQKTKATAAELRATWTAQGSEWLGEVRTIIERTIRTSAARPTLDATAPLVSAEAHVFERRSVVDERLLWREALIVGRGDVNLAELKAATEHRVGTGELLRVGGDLASRAALQAEDEFVTWAEAGKSGLEPLGVKPPNADKLDEDQEHAVAAVLRSRSRITIIQGDAGTGKTASLKRALAGIEAAGGRVFGCAPSAGATDVLRKELTAEADTLQQLLVNPRLQGTIRGRTIIVDEAGLIAVREMRDLCRIAAANDNRLLLVGDVKQHNSVEAGDALRCLQAFARVPVVRLTRIRRQRDPHYRAAVARLARGDAIGAFNQFVRLGSVREVREPQRMFGLAADDYVQTVAGGKSCLAISPVWSEIHAFTSEVRTRLKRVGVLAAEDRRMRTVHSLKWTREERRRIENYRPGDVLTFHRDAQDFAKNEHAVVIKREGCSLVVRRGDGRERHLNPRISSGYDVGIEKEINVALGDRLLVRSNLKPAGLKNGDLVEVVSFTGTGDISLSDGRTIPAWFRQFSHGYAATSHSSQGKTVDRGIVLMAHEGIATGNLRQAYVSNSRFRESQVIFTTDADGAREAMQRPGERMLASELVPPRLANVSFRPTFLSRLFRGGPRPSARAMLRGFPPAQSGAPTEVLANNN